MRPTKSQLETRIVRLEAALRAFVLCVEEGFDTKDTVRVAKDLLGDS